MNYVYVIVAIVAALIGAAIVFLVSKLTKKNATERKQNTDQHGLELESQKQSLEDKYKRLLSESESRINDLNKQLASALDGKLDNVTKESLAQVDDLKKKIKDLETEIEDYEDDLDDAKKKLKKKESESAELQESLSAFARDANRLKSDVESLTTNLAQAQQELRLKRESLTFIQEVLSAKEAKDDRTNTLYAKVAEMVDYIEGDLRDNVKEICGLSPEFDKRFFDDALYGWAGRKKKSWMTGKTSIAFVGEFSAGKTSIVNRILSQDTPDVPLLPVSTKATTAIPTYISGAGGPFFQFVSPDNILKDISPETFRKVNKEVLDQVHGVSSLIKYFVMGYKNPVLNSLSVLDTPGFNSNDPEDANRTIEVINECDALFWVFDVNAGTVNRTSLELIKNHLTKPLYIVINKVDTKPQSEVDKVEKLIRATLAEAQVQCQGIIRFSSKAPLDSIMKPISQIKRDESQELYLDELNEFIKAQVADLKKSVLQQKRETDTWKKKLEELREEYHNVTEDLENDCETAAAIPQYKSGILGIGAGYKMDDNQHALLIETLNRISNDLVKTDLERLFEEMMEVAMNYSTSYDNHARVRRNWQILDDSFEKFNRLANNVR